MNDPYDGHETEIDYGFDAYEDATDRAWRKPNRRQRSGSRREKSRKPRRTDMGRRFGRVEAADGTFRCRKCKTMVGPPISGGRHRNHCPLCLYSRHVDRSRPGDRMSECRSLMRPTGLFTRRNGEQMLVHECLGCGIRRHIRIAADDNTVATMRLPVLAEPARVVEEETARPA